MNDFETWEKRRAKAERVQRDNPTTTHSSLQTFSFSTMADASVVDPVEDNLDENDDGADAVRIKLIRRERESRERADLSFLRSFRSTGAGSYEAES